MVEVKTEKRIHGIGKNGERRWREEWWLRRWSGAEVTTRGSFSTGRAAVQSVVVRTGAFDWVR